MESHSNQIHQRLDQFSLPPDLRGKPAWFVQLWQVIQVTLFAMSPQFFYGWRRMLLRMFGAKVGKGVLIRPSVTITFPWKVSFDEHAWVGDDVVLYSIAEIHIGDHAVISQRSYLCTASHDYRKPTFDTVIAPILVENAVWIATDVFIAPGVQLGKGCVVGARSSVFSDLPESMICVGSPAKAIRKR